MLFSKVMQGIMQRMILTDESIPVVEIMKDDMKERKKDTDE